MTCKTCKHAQFERTPTGRIARGTRGECRYEVVIPVLPASLRLAHLYRHGIWPDFGTDCPTYEKK